MRCFDLYLLFHNRPVHFSGLSARHGDDFILQPSRNEIYEAGFETCESNGPSRAQRLA